VIFHDATLAAIAARAPGSLEDLQGVSGIGVAKLEKYGDAVLAVCEAQGASSLQPYTPESIASHDHFTLGSGHFYCKNPMERASRTSGLMRCSASSWSRNSSG
jgi:hypothetical protein